MSLSFLLVILSQLLVLVFLLATVGEWVLWVALVAALLAAFVAFSKKDREVG